MTLPFQQIPQGLLVPLFYAEVDPSHANTASQNQRTLIIGQITGAGLAAPNVPVVSQGVTDAAYRGGPGSMLALMTSTYRKFDQFGEVWYLPLADNGAGTLAAGTVTITGPSTAAGTLNFYVAGFLTQTAVTSGMTATQVATALAATINANVNLPVTASPAAGVVTITAKNKGLAGNDITFAPNLRGSRGGEATPAGLALVLVQPSGGTANPVLTTALANLATMPFDFIVSPYTDATSIAAISAFLSDNGGRWSWTTQLYGHCFIAKRQTFGGLITFGATVNDQHLSCLGAYPDPGESPEWLWSAAFAASCAVSCRADPGQPVQTSALLGVFPVTNPNALFSPALQQTLLSTGISTFNQDTQGNLSIGRAITTYQFDAFAQPDNSYLSIETMFTLTAVLRALAGVVTSKFARCKLAADGTNFAPGSNIVTPSIIRGVIIASYMELEFNGLVQRADEFAAALIVQQNSENPNRVDVLYPAVLINQLTIFAALAQFRLS